MKDVAIAEKVLSGEYSYTEGPFSAVTGQPIYPHWAPAYAREVKVLHALPQTLTSKIQALRVGPAGFAALPGEIFVEIGLAVKAGSPFAPQFVMSLANDYLGYVATDEQLALGAYETWPSRSAIGGPGIGRGYGDHGAGIAQFAGGRVNALAVLSVRLAMSNPLVQSAGLLSRQFETCGVVVVTPAKAGMTE